MFRIFTSRSAIRLVCALGAAIGMTGAVAARPLDEVVGSGILRVIAYLDNAPFSWDDNGAPKGIDVDIAKAIANELGVKPEIIIRMPGEKGDDDLRVNVCHLIGIGGFHRQHHAVVCSL